MSYAVICASLRVTAFHSLPSGMQSGALGLATGEQAQLPGRAHAAGDSGPAVFSHSGLSFLAIIQGQQLLLQVDVGANCPCAWWITSPLGTPRGRYDECSG
jgi:hypothetical protein